VKYYKPKRKVSSDFSVDNKKNYCNIMKFKWGVFCMYPILEFDPDRKALINPEDLYSVLDDAEYCVISYFREVIEKVASEYQAEIIKILKAESADFPVYQIDYKGKKVAFVVGGVGAPLGAGLMEELIALGYRKIVACGGAGVLEQEIQCGKLVVVESAVRDEGTSYHYLEPAREIHARKDIVDVLCSTLEKHKVSYIKGKTWTTDAFFRETRARIEKRKSEQCIMVEMEAAAFLAVAEFRNISFGEILYGGDDVSGEKWDSRSWSKRVDIRENLFWLAVECCCAIP